MYRALERADEGKRNRETIRFQADGDKLSRLFHSLCLQSYGQCQSAVCGVRRPVQQPAGSDWALL